MFDNAMYYVTISLQGKMFVVLVSYMTLDQFIIEFNNRMSEFPKIVSMVDMDEDEFETISEMIVNKSQIFEGDDK